MLSPCSGVGLQQLFFRLFLLPTYFFLLWNFYYGTGVSVPCVRHLSLLSSCPVIAKGSLGGRVHHSLLTIPISTHLRETYG